jgi:hypothetical protein
MNGNENERKDARQNSVQVYTEFDRDRAILNGIHLGFQVFQGGDYEECRLLGSTARHWYNRTNSGRRTKRTQPHCTPRNKKRYGKRFNASGSY